MTIQPITLRIAVPAHLRRYFDYLPLEGMDISHLKPGMRVRVPFQKRELIGVFVGTSTESDVPVSKLKPIIEVLDEESVMSADMLHLCHWAADYYHYPVGEIILGALPGKLRQGEKNLPIPRVTRRPAATPTRRPAACPRDPGGMRVILDPANKSQDDGCAGQLALTLNSAQQSALSAIQKSSNTFQVHLLDGITGSGKTEVYLQAIADILARDQQALVLVPEIGLTPQTIQRFSERFAVPIATVHSNMTEKKRLQAWQLAKNGTAKIVIGTRSAVFTPFAKLGLIIIDEEHDLSFKQQDTFRYHARDVAIMRAHYNKIPIVLGSATPSLETLHNAQQQRYQHLQLPERAGTAKLPTYHMIDIRNLTLEQGLSPPLLNEMKQHLERNEQVMLFLNRRGFAPVLMCHACGWMAMCKRCDMRMTYHQKFKRLHCHHCDSQKKIPTTCEQCKAKELIAVGQGTERLEDALTQFFPHYSIARIDRDTTRRKGAMETMLEEIQEGKHQILIGTQMLAKGHHFPNVTLVAIIDADGGFFSADFRALERMGQLLLQVSGRAGRDEKPGKVFIQTRHPDHPLLHQLVNENYQRFALSLLKERSQTQLPPHSFFALFRAEAHNSSHAMDFLQQIKNKISEAQHPINLLGPVAAPMPLRAGRYRVHLLLQAKHRSILQQLLKILLPQVETLPVKQKVRWSLDVDPVEMF